MYACIAIKFYTKHTYKWLILYRIVGMFGGDKVWRITSSKVVGKKSLANAYSNVVWLIIIIIMKCEKVLDGLSLVNALLFAKFAKLSHYTVTKNYDIKIMITPTKAHTGTHLKAYNHI